MPVPAIKVLFMGQWQHKPLNIILIERDAGLRKRLDLTQS